MLITILIKFFHSPSCVTVGSITNTIAASPASHTGHDESAASVHPACAARRKTWRRPILPRNAPAQPPLPRLANAAGSCKWLRQLNPSPASSVYSPAARFSLISCRHTIRPRTFPAPAGIRPGHKRAFAVHHNILVITQHHSRSPALLPDTPRQKRRCKPADLLGQTPGRDYRHGHTRQFRQRRRPRSKLHGLPAPE